jgi:hypothetical protein
MAAVPKTKHTRFFTAAPSKRYADGGHWINPKRLNEDFLKMLAKLNTPAGRKNGGFTEHSLRHFFKPIVLTAECPSPSWIPGKVTRSTCPRVLNIANSRIRRFSDSWKWCPLTPASRRPMPADGSLKEGFLMSTHLLTHTTLVMMAAMADACSAASGAGPNVSHDHADTREVPKLDKTWT